MRFNMLKHMPNHDHALLYRGAAVLQTRADLLHKSTALLHRGQQPLKFGTENIAYLSTLFTTALNILSSIVLN